MRALLSHYRSLSVALVFLDVDSCQFFGSLFLASGSHHLQVQKYISMIQKPNQSSLHLDSLNSN
jgi:hypothetical protein